MQATLLEPLEEEASGSITAAPPVVKGRDVKQFARVMRVPSYLALRPRPDTTVPEIKQLRFNDRLFVVRKLDTPPGWSFVVTDDGKYGYVNDQWLFVGPPEPNAFLHLIAHGDAPFTLAQTYYRDALRFGEDKRFYTNVLVYVNRGEGDKRKGIYKENKDDSWQKTKTTAGVYIWVPSVKFVQTLHDHVPSGSISYEAWRTFMDVLSTTWDWVKFGAAFVAGIVHGALECVWDTLTGIIDLIEMVWDLIRALLEDAIGHAKELWDLLSFEKLKEAGQMLVADFQAKWDSSSSIEKGHFRGWVVGYLIAEIAIAIFTAGSATALKASARVSAAIRALGKLRPLAKLQDKAADILKKTKGARNDVHRALKLRRARAAVQRANADRIARGLTGRYDIGPWDEMHRRGGRELPSKDLWTAGLDPKIVSIPPGRPPLYAAGPDHGRMPKWGAFEELDLDWYARSNQLDPAWYVKPGDPPLPFYEYTITIEQPTPAVMSRFADQPGAPARIGPLGKMQYYNPDGLGARRDIGKLLGHLHSSGAFVPLPGTPVKPKP